MCGTCSISSDRTDGSENYKENQFHQYFSNNLWSWQSFNRQSNSFIKHLVWKPTCIHGEVHHWFEHSKTRLVVIPNCSYCVQHCTGNNLSENITICFSEYCYNKNNAWYTLLSIETFYYKTIIIWKADYSLMSN